MMKLLKTILPESVQNTAFIRLFGLTKVPLIYWVNPSVIKMDDDECIIKIPLTRRTKNHLNSMYFGVLCVGADIAGGLVAMNEITNSKRKVSLAFKDFKAEFHKRPEGDVYFSCSQISELKSFVNEVITSGIRMNHPVVIKAYVPSIDPNEVVASFELTLSLKLKA